MYAAVAVVAAYVLGGIPGVGLSARLAGGRPWALAVGHLADAAKGMLLVSLLAPQGSLAQALVAAAAVAGHRWPVLGRRDRSALATAAGALTVLTPLSAPLWGVLWSLAYVVSGFPSLGRIVASLALPFVLGFVAGWPIGWTTAPACLALLVAERIPLRRLLLGTESRHYWRGEA